MLRISEAESVNVISSDESSDDSMDNYSRASPVCSLDVALVLISPSASVSVNRTHERHLSNFTKYDYVRFMSLHRYFNLVKSGTSKMKASAEAALLFPAKSTRYQARSIRNWARYFLENRRLPNHRQGKHIKTMSLIYDEDIASHCRRYLKSQINDSITAQSFANLVKDILHLETDLANSVLISERTAIRWLHHLGMDYLKYCKGLYIDGHERPDIVEYRDAFLNGWLSIKSSSFSTAATT